MSNEYTNGLREIADFFDSTVGLNLKDNPSTHEWGEDFYVDVTVYMPWNTGSDAGYNTEIDVPATQLELARWLDAMGTGVEKKYSDASFTMTKKFGPHTLRVRANREVVCKRVVIGQEEIPEEIIPAHTKDITETICAKVSFKAILAEEGE